MYRTERFVLRSVSTSTCMAAGMTLEMLVASEPSASCLLSCRTPSLGSG
jgi:hypothetical protein